MFKKFLAEHSLNEYTFRSDLLPTVEDRDFWESFPNDTCIEEAQAELDFCWPVILATDFMAFKTRADRVVMQKPHYDRRNHLILFTLAELKENKGRFIPQITNGLFAICEESYWGVSAHWLVIDEPGNIPTPAEPYVDLFAAETAEHLATVCHVLEKPLAAFCPEILARVEYELERRVKKPYESRRDFWWMGHLGKKVNNWNPWILSNVLTVFLLTEQNQRRLGRALEKMLTEIQYYYDTIPEDGGCDEGAHYWSRAGASLFEFVYQLKQSTNGALDLFGDEKLGRIASYMQKVHVTNDRFYNIADTHTSGQTDSLLLLYAFAKQTKQPSLMNFAAAAYATKEEQADLLPHTTRTLRRLIYQSSALHEMKEYPITYPLHGEIEHLPDLEIAALRQGDLTLHAKGGHNKEGHNHNDVASFTLYDGNTPVLVDVGINTYTGLHFKRETRYTVIPWTRSIYHNLPIVNDTEQKDGRTFCADAFTVKKGEISISFADAYPTQAKVDKLVRTLSLTEKGLRITDRASFTGEQKALTEVLMIVLPVCVENDAVIIDGKYRARAAGARLSIQEVPFEDASLEKDWNTDHVTRLLLEFEDTEEICIEVEKI